MTESEVIFTVMSDVSVGYSAQIKKFGSQVWLLVFLWNQNEILRVNKT